MREDLRHGLEMALRCRPPTYAGVAALGYFPGISNGVLAADDRAVREIEDARGIAERAGNDMAPEFARMALGVALAHRHTAAERDRGLTLMAEVSDVFARHAHNLGDRPLVDVYVARERAWRGNSTRRYRRRGRIHRAPGPRGQLLAWGVPATGVLAQTLLIGAPTVTWPKPRPPELQRLAVAPADEDRIIRDIWLS